MNKTDRLPAAYNFLFAIACAACVAVITTRSLSAADTIPGPRQPAPIALVNGTVFPVSAAPIEDGVVLFADGKIAAVGPRSTVKIPEATEVIELPPGRHVYPGLFEAHSRLGLFEISAVRATLDYKESGDLNPNVRAHVSINPDSEHFPVTRANGVLLALTSPAGGRIPGQAAVLQLDGWTYEDMTLHPAAGLMVNWPEVNASLETAADADNPLESLEQLFVDARAYLREREHGAGQGETISTNLKLESLQPVLAGDVPLIVAAHELAQIQSAVAFTVRHRLKMILFGGHDAPLCADLLKEHKIPVIVSAVYRLPRRRHEAFDVCYTLPKRLLDANIPFCISGSEASQMANVRNLPYHAATAVAYGLPHEIAIRSITLAPAEILGVADRVGSLDVGKDATLFVCSGDPLETPQRVERAWIQGRAVDLNNRQEQLFRKYEQKYQQLDR